MLSHKPKVENIGEADTRLHTKLKHVSISLNLIGNKYIFFYVLLASGKSSFGHLPSILVQLSSDDVRYGHFFCIPKCSPPPVNDNFLNGSLLESAPQIFCPFQYDIVHFKHEFSIGTVKTLIPLVRNN